jgi:release factor glutamine methyltransferase
MKQWEELNIGQLLTRGFQILKEAGIDSYKLDCQLLLAKVLTKDKLFIMLNRDVNVDREKAEEYFKLVNLRKDKMPIKYILKECEFMGFNFNISEGVLIPRPDTETLVQCALKDIEKNNYKQICDVCCGSGIIGISIGKLTEDTFIDCFDIMDIPLKITESNILLHKLKHRVRVYKSDLLKYAIDNGKRYDMVVSNPPYIKEEIIETLMEDVKNYEPHIALNGGEDGLNFYRKIIEQSKILLNANGGIVFEIGYDEGEEVMRLLKDNGFYNIECIKDLSGLDRVVKGCYGL